MSTKPFGSLSSRHQELGDDADDEADDDGPDDVHVRHFYSGPEKVRDSTPMMMAKERTASSGTFWPVRLPDASMSVASFSV